jgi:cytochrome oxidase Cu insertion factor (SCO1/SenC/PrrC family)
MPQRRGLTAGMLVLTWAVALSGCGGGRYMVGQMAPDFTLRDLSGQDVSLSDFKGRPVLLSFWGAG